MAGSMLRPRHPVPCPNEAVSSNRERLKRLISPKLLLPGAFLTLKPSPISNFENP